MSKKKLAVIITHPIQYYAPVFKLLTERGKVELKVFYTWGEESVAKFDPGFGKKIEWDIPVLEGYNYQFLRNTAKQPGSNHFSGINNPDAIAQVEAFKPNAILIYGWAYQSHLKILRYFNKKIPVWFRGDSNLNDSIPGWKSLLRGIFLTWIYKHIDKALYVGQANKAYYLKYGVKENQLCFAPHAIDNYRFNQPREREVFELRKNLGILDFEILILFAGKLEPKKDPGLLLQAFRELNLRNVHLLFVGNGVLEEELKRECNLRDEKQEVRDKSQEFRSEKREARGKSQEFRNETLESGAMSQEFGVENLENESEDWKQRVHFMDFQNQQMMPVIYQACDLFCLPSKGPRETWGLAVNEAMAAGKAVLVSDKVGCHPDLIKENGEVFQSGNLDQLKDKLNLLTNSGDRLVTQGTISRDIIKNWSFEKQAICIEEILR